jgi:hypothetical protein
MIKVEIKKNGKVIKTFLCKKSDLQKTFNKAHNVAGGLWNGTDTFTVNIGQDQFCMTAKLLVITDILN